MADRRLESDDNEENNGPLKKRKEVTCFGCLNNRPGQREHMELGGCLYRREENQ